MSPPDRRLVWIPGDAEYLSHHAPPGLELVTIPDDPASDPRLAKVALLVAGYRDDLSEHYRSMDALQVVQTTLIGVDGLVGTMPPGVTLCSSRGTADVAVSEWVVALILAGEKNLPAIHTDQLHATWQMLPTRILADETVLILGSGSIGRAVIERLGAFGCEILEVARRPRPGVFTLDDLGGLLPRADVVVVCLALTEATTGLIDRPFFDAMRPGALLVNIARGAIVVTDDLIDALGRGQVRAVLDVTDPEPLPEIHPLWSAPGVFITPHSAGLTPNGQARSYPFIAAQLERFANGAPLENVVADGY